MRRGILNEVQKIFFKIFSFLAWVVLAGRAAFGGRRAERGKNGKSRAENVKGAGQPSPR